MKNKHPLIFNIILIGSILSACGAPTTLQATTEPAPRVDATSTPVNTPVPSLGVDPAALRGLNIRVMNAWFGAPQALFEKQIQEFNQSNEWGIVVQSQAEPTYSSLFDSMTLMLVQTTYPELAATLPEQILAWNQVAKVAELSPYVTDPVYGWSEAARADLVDVFWAQDKIGETVLAIPAARSSNFLLYNTTWAKELGFSAAPKNAIEFREQACKANQSYKVGEDPLDDGFGGWAVNTNADTALAWMLAFNGGAVDEVGYQFQTENNLEAFTFVKDLYDKNCAWLSSEDEIYNQFALRRALFATASIPELSNTLRAFRENASTDQWTAIPFAGDTQAVVTYGPSYTVFKSTPEKELAAWLFIKWMLTPENQNRWVENTGYLPVLKSQMSMLKTYADSHPQWTDAVSLLAFAQNPPQRASWRQVKYVLGDAFDGIFRVNLAIDRITVTLYQLNAMAQELDK